MVSELTSSALIEYLEALSDSDALEIYPVSVQESGTSVSSNSMMTETLSSGEFSVYIPYMMNDAVECCIILSCDHMDPFRSFKEHLVFLDLIDNESEGTSELFFLCEEKEIRIGFRKAVLSTNCYQYHRIGHFWVQGDEALRRLVYEIGTMNEKCLFMEASCYTEKELQLIPLMGFSPFRYFSPVRDNLDSYYEDTIEGIEAFQKLASVFGSQAFQNHLQKYKLEFLKGTKSREHALEISFLLRNEREIIRELNRRVIETSLQYPERQYPEKETGILRKQISEVCETMKQEGYEGTYPEFYKENDHVIYYEEHPYVLKEVEYDDFELRISGCIHD